MITNICKFFMCVEGLGILKFFCKLKFSAKSRKLNLIKNAFENEN